MILILSVVLEKMGTRRKKEGDNKTPIGTFTIGNYFLEKIE